MPAVAEQTVALGRPMTTVLAPGSDRRWFLGTVAAALLLAVLGSRWTQGMWAFAPDEMLFRSTAGWVPTDLPWSLVDLPVYERGLQRLGIWIEALGLGLFDSPDGFRVARWLFVLVWASAVAPIWLLARGAGAEPPWAAVGALIGVVVPWAILSGTFLTEPIAYPVFAWAMLAFWACAVRGGPRADLLALAAILAVGLARTGLLVVVGALAVLLLGQELRLAPRRGGLRRLPANLLARHRVLVVAGGIVALAALVGGLRRALGVYEGVVPHPDRLADGVSFLVATVAPGITYVALIAAVAFALTQLVRADDEGQLALALVVLGAFAVVVVIAMTGNVEERYVFYWAAPCAAAFAVAASRRSVAWWAGIASAALVLWACDRQVWPTGEPFVDSFYFLPAETWNSQVMRLGISARLPDAFGLGTDAVQVLLILGATLVAAALTLPAPRRLAESRAVHAGGLAVGAALVLAGTVQVAWVLKGYADHGGGGRPLARLPWVDRAADGGAVGLWLPPAPPRTWAPRSGAASADNDPWRLVRYYNLSIRGAVRMSPGQEPRDLPGDRPSVTVGVDPSTGRVRVPAGERLPPLLVVLPARDSVPLRGRVVARGPDRGMVLLRPTRPPSARRAIVRGPADGHLVAGRALTMRSFAPYGASPACLRLTLAAYAPAAQLEVDTGRGVRRVAVPAGTAATLTVRLRGRPTADVIVRALAGSGAADVSALGPVRCPAPASP